MISSIDFPNHDKERFHLHIMLLLLHLLVDGMRKHFGFIWRGEGGFKG